MRLFVQVADGVPIKWPLTSSMVRGMAPADTSFPASDAPYELVDLSEFGFETFHLSARPEYNPDTHKAVELPPVKINGRWTQQWALDAYTPPAPTIEDFTTALEAMYDAKAQEKQYDTRYTCALRAGYASPFQAEGLAFAQWMDQCNASAYTIMGNVLAGNTPMPTVAKLLAQMPVLTWPA